MSYSSAFQDTAAAAIPAFDYFLGTANASVFMFVLAFVVVLPSIRQRTCWRARQ